MRTLDGHVSPYTSTERLPADPPDVATCPTCDAEYVPEPDEAECGDCLSARFMLSALDEDGRVAAFRDLEDDAAWHRRRLAGHMAACREVSDAR